MPLQNRVDPFGAIHAVSERGLFTGNRGIIHNPATRTLLTRRWSTRAWITCTCSFRGRRRELMGPGKNGNGSWTELFFLDEVTALAAGHRPCYYCRRPSARAFAEHLSGSFNGDVPRAGDIDHRLHRERLAAGAVPIPIDQAALKNLPDGAMIADDRQAFAIWRGDLLPWTFAGYGNPKPVTELISGGRLITPPLTCVALHAGYRPIWHASAGA